MWTRRTVNRNNFNATYWEFFFTAIYAAIFEVVEDLFASTLTIFFKQLVPLSFQNRLIGVSAFSFMITTLKLSPNSFFASSSWQITPTATKMV